jgi:hypothetical protein
MGDSGSTGAWHTFTFRLPFTLGLTYTGNEHHDMLVSPPPDWEGTQVWAEPSSSDAYGPVGIVRLKFYASPESGIEMFPRGLESALHGIYPDSEFRSSDGTWPLLGEDNTDVYEQWVSAETSPNRLSWEDPQDEAFAFHRVLRALNLFLLGYSVGLGNTRVRQIAPEDLDPVVAHGKWTLATGWFDPGVLIMPLEWTPKPLPMLDLSTAAPLIGSGIDAVTTGHPYVPMKVWLTRSMRAQRRGDQVDRVVSLQTSAESMFSATFRMTLVDAGSSSHEIQEQSEYDSYKWLITSRLPQLLGGDWSVQRLNSDLGRYWVDLYELRNRVVHAGYEPSPIEGDRAEAAFRRVRDYLNQRVWARRKTYPRTMLARIGDPEGAGFTNGGVWLRDLRAQLKSEPGIWWWAWDLAGRAAPDASTHQ